MALLACLCSFQHLFAGAHDQPRPLEVPAGQSHDVAMSGGDHLGRIVELCGRRVDGRAVRGDRLDQHRFDDRPLALEVVVERAEADVGLVRDLVDARVVDAPRANSVRAACRSLARVCSRRRAWRSGAGATVPDRLAIFDEAISM
jgi:hypothetical protein